ncbi:MAG: hypothetical protein ABS36_12525 [Acidobacteria bacterium SCN 69-37]|nr:MAG: hypothetical protein ABS36_12525 [Acidobacteria bacterium SCN 69-37]
MRTIYFRTILSGLAVFTLATAAAAQDRTALLTSIEVKQLVANGQPGDHARLRDHFAAVGATYEADAQRHRAMALVQTGNPNHPPAVPPSVYHNQRAEASAKSAVALRELSEHHGRLAAGMPSNAPESAARFESGEGAPAPTDAQLRELAAGARTATEHRMLGEYFTELAAKYTRRAQKHAAMAVSYRGHPSDRTGSFTALASHCERLAKLSREFANAARASAAEHHRLAPR